MSVSIPRSEQQSILGASFFDSICVMSIIAEAAWAVEFSLDITDILADVPGSFKGHFHDE